MTILILILFCLSILTKRCEDTDFVRPKYHYCSNNTQHNIISSFILLPKLITNWIAYQTLSIFLLIGKIEKNPGPPIKSCKELCTIKHKM